MPDRRRAAPLADADVMRSRTTSTEPGVLNGAVLTADPADPAAALDRADAFFQSERRAYGFWVVASRDVHMASHLRGSGFTMIADDPHMIASANDLHVSHQPDAHLSVVSSDADRLAFVSCAGRAFRDLGVDPSTWASVYPSLESVPQYDVITVQASDGTQPAAGAMGYLHQGVCEIIHVATVPDARNRGLGAAVTASVVEEAAARGASHAVLQSTQMGLNVYRGLGFREIDRYQLFLRSTT
jgi:ribosomal protein S18 acetylase RimI-like enzyme